MDNLEEKVATLEAIIVGLLDEVVELKGKETTRQANAEQKRKIDAAKKASLAGFGALDRHNAQHALAQMDTAQAAAHTQARSAFNAQAAAQGLGSFGQASSQQAQHNIFDDHRLSHSAFTVERDKDGLLKTIRSIGQSIAGLRKVGQGK